MKTKTYLMKDLSTELYKIGKSVNPIHRERTLQCEKPTISILSYCEYDIEVTLHDKFALKRVRGEWFNLDNKDVDFILDLFSTKHIKTITNKLARYSPEYTESITVSPKELQKMINAAVADARMCVRLDNSLEVKKESDFSDFITNKHNLSVNISFDDLQKIVNYIISETRNELAQSVVDEKSETYLTAKQTSEKLDVDLTTLWRWEKQGILLPVRAGKKRRYKMSDIRSMLNV